MNRDHRHHLDDDGAVDLTRHRLAGELRAAARLVELAPGSEVAAVARGRRLRERRRRATALAAVVAVGGGSAVAIQQLDGGDSFLAGTASSVASIPDAAVVEETPAPPPATEPAPVDPASLTLPEVVEPLYAWNVVEPDSAEAVGFTLKIGDIPGLALASEPGRSDEYRPAVWRSEDGVSWEQVELDLPFGTLEQLDFDGDTIYLVGTAPGVAAGEPNPLKFATSGDLGTTWQTIELPVDTGEVNDAPYVRGVSDYADPIPLDDGSSLVVVSRSIDVDAEAIGADLGIDAAGAWVFDESGITFFTGCSPDGLSARPSAAPSVAGAIVEVAPATTAVPATTAAYPVGPEPAVGCEERLVPWAETGLPAELLDGVTTPQIRVFHIVGGVATELDVPAGVYGSAGVPGPVFSGEDSWYRFEDGAFVEIPPADGGAGPVGETASTQFWIGTPAAFPSTLDPGILITASTDGAATESVDWSALYGDGRYGYPSATVVGATGLVMASQVWNDAIAADGGVSVTVDGYTISRASRRDPLQVVTPDGETVDPALVTVDDALVVRDADGSETARFAIPSNSALERAVWGYVPPDDRPADFLLMASTDGRRVSVESIPDLLGVDVDEVASVDRVTPVGQQVVVAVTLRERGPDDLPRQLVLVGTPVG